jgi:Kef-type K+ transport system membrane component KefB
MPSLAEAQVLMMLAALAVILLLARAAGEVARRLGQPEMLGEFVAGFLLGPSALGALLPGVYAALFQETGTAFALSGLSWIGAILLLLIAGLEVDLPILRGEVKTWSLAAAGAILPVLAVGAALALVVLRRPITSALFLGIVLSVTAVSVAARVHSRW